GCADESDCHLIRHVECFDQDSFVPLQSCRILHQELRELVKAWVMHMRIIIPPATPDATSLRCSLQFRGKSAVESVPEWKQEHLLGQFEAGKFLCHGLDYFFILFRLDAACAVDQDAFSF